LGIAEFVYTVLLKPAPLRGLANMVIRAIVPSRVRRNGAIVVLNPTDPVISAALTFSIYEKAETRFLGGQLRPGITFLDIGANVGYYTALAQVQLKGEGRIVALEPDPENFSFLLQTVEANTFRNVDCLQKAAADRPGKVQLYTSRDNRGDNRLYANNLCDGAVEVECIVLDSLLPDLGISSLDLVKIDVQGFEANVIAGLRETLRRSPRCVILSEFWPQGLRDAGSDPKVYMDGLRELGMKLFELDHQGGLALIGDDNALIARNSGRVYTNIVAAASGAQLATGLA
jgi:FkbM family methyltransferase